MVRKLEEALLKDRSRCTVVEMSELGLVEMTRKRLRKEIDSFYESLVLSARRGKNIVSGNYSS